MFWCYCSAAEASSTPEEDDNSFDGESTLKTYLVKGGKPYLRAENPKYPNLIPAQELMIQGVFKALIRKARE